MLSEERPEPGSNHDFLQAGQLIQSLLMIEVNSRNGHRLIEISKIDDLVS